MQHQPSTNIRMLPHSIEAEQAVLASILVDYRCYGSVSGFLQPEHFYREAHQLIYKAMGKVAAKHEPIDHMTLTDELERMGKLEQVGGPYYLTELWNDILSSDNALYYAQIVEKKARHRAIISECAAIAASAYQEDDSILTQAQSRMFAVCQTRAGNPIISHRQALNEYMEMISDLHDRSGEDGVFTGIPTNFKRLDAILGGWRAAKLYIIAARPGDGKTALAMTFMHHAIKKGYRGLFFSIEMERHELMQRMVAMEARVNSKDLRDVRLDGEDEYGISDWERVVDGIARLQATSGTLWIDDTSGNTIERMRARAMQMQAEEGLDFIVLDYLQLAEVEDDGRRAENRRLEVEKVSRDLKGLSRELNIPILALAQLNRNIESRPGHLPQLSDLREAGGIEQDGDVVAFIYKDPTTPKDAKEFDVSLIIEKHRNGERGIVSMHYTGPYTKFTPITSVPEEAAQ